ncbi:MAG TPA: YkgJ family cysteine cluster protein [Polyangiales bacterium]
MGKRNLPITLDRKGNVPCLKCGLCCSYIAVAIDAPDSVKAATEILWHLYHDYVSVYRDSDDEWMVQFETRCRHLASDNKCKIYETRPHICRTYSEDTCEVNADDEGMSFYSPDTFLAYLQTRSKRIYAGVQKGYLPGPEHLKPRKLGTDRAPPRFEQRFQVLRAAHEERD